MKMTCSALRVAVALSALLACPSVRASTITWSAAGGGDWATSANWGGATIGTSNTAVVNIHPSSDITNGGSALSVANLEFDTNVGSVNFGNNTSGATLTVQTSVLILPTIVGTNNTINIKAPVTIGTGATSQTVTFGNYSSDPGTSLNFSGNITASGSGSTTLILSGTAPGTISGNVGPGSGTGFALVNDSATSTWTLTGTNTLADTGTGGISGSAIQFGLNPGAISEIGGGTIKVTGTLTGTPDVGFVMGGTLNIAEPAGSSQSLGTVYVGNKGGAGDDVIQSTYGGSGNTTLTIGSLSSGNYSTLNFVTTNGANGSTNKIVINSGVTANTFMGTAYFYNGSNFAWYDSGGYVRGINYGVDAGSVTTAGAASVTGTYVQTTGAVTSQTTTTYTTLDLAGTSTTAGNNDFTLGSTSTLTVAGILRAGNVSGSEATISGGAIKPNASQLVIRTDGVNDTLIINSNIVANSSDGLTKSGSGTLTINGSDAQAGPLIVDGGVLNLNAAYTGQSSFATIYVSGTNSVLNEGVNGSIGGSGAFTITDNSAVTFSGSNSFTGTINVTYGTLTLNNNNALASGVTVLEGNPGVAGYPAGTLILENGITSTGTVGIDGYGAAGQNGAIVSLTGTNTLSGQIRLGAGSGPNVIDVEAGSKLVFSNSSQWLNDGTVRTTIFTGAGTGVDDGVLGGTNSPTMSGTGTWSLLAANTYTGVTTINAGTLAVNTLANGASTANSLGESSNAASNLLIANGATLQYVGSGNSTDRLFTINGTAAGATAALDASGTGAVSFTNTNTLAYGTTNQTRTLILTGTNTGLNTFSADLADNGTGATSLTKNGVGTWELTPSVALGYSGATTVNAGALILASGASLSNTSAIAVNGGSFIANGNVTAHNTTTVASGATLGGTGSVYNATIQSGGNINLVDNTIGTLTVGNTLSLTGAALTFEIGTSLGSIDSISAGTLSIGTGTTTITIDNLNNALNQSIVAGTDAYQLMGYTSLSGSLSNLKLSTTTLDGYNLSLDTSNPFYIYLDVTPNSIAAGYYNGVGADLNSAADYDTTVSSGTAIGVAPSGVTNLYFAANRNNQASPQLTGTMTANSLTFGAGTSGTQTGFDIGTTSSSNTLTIMAGASGTVPAGQGIYVNAGGGNNTISAPIALGATQTWTVTDATSTLTVSGNVGDGGNNYKLTKAGLGKLLLSGSNSYGGGTEVSAGKLLLANGGNGSATGSGTLKVDSGATIGGAGTGLTGTSISSSFLINGSIIVGNGSDATSSLKIAAGASGTVDGTLSGASLTFNLDSASHNANLLDLGSTNVTFSNTTLTLNLLGTTVITPYSPYTLITDAAGFNSATDGLSTQSETINGHTYNVIIGGLSIASSTYFGTPVNGFTTGAYANSFLYIDGNNIDVAVVPEPGTWALMLGGLAMLLFIQHHRNRRKQ